MKAAFKSNEVVTSAATLSVKSRGVEPDPETWVPVRHSLWGKRVVQIKQCFLVFNRPNRSGAGAKRFICLELEPEICVLVPLHWSQGIKKS